MIAQDTLFPRAILFDMDGTLTAPVFDFPAARREMGLPPGAPILEGIAAMPPQQRARAEKILCRFEDEVAENAPLAEGCLDLLKFLQQRQVKLAVITRNRRCSVAKFLERFSLPISVWVTREDAPHKPDPSSLELACRQLGISTRESWMVGDGEFDVQAAINAGSKSIWLSLNRPRHFAAEPWKTVNDLLELHAFLKTY